MTMKFKVLAAIVLAMTFVQLRAQDYKPSPELEALHVPFDALLDLHVRDGLVYYRALQGDRDRLNRYIASLNTARDYVGVRAMVRRAEEGALDQRVQRARAADRRQQLSDSGASVELSREQHQADSRRLREDTHVIAGKERDARSDSRTRCSLSSTMRGCISCLGVARSAAAGCGARRSAPGPSTGSSTMPASNSW
jgi:hypothetical protein